MKVKRHNKILEIIEKYNVETQEELIEKLRLAGFNVTQATISRDIRELGLLKVLMSNGSYKYMRPDIDSGSGQMLLGMAIFMVCATLSTLLLGIVKSLASSRINTKLNITVEAASMMRLLSLPANFFKTYSSFVNFLNS